MLSAADLSDESADRCNKADAAPVSAGASTSTGSPAYPADSLREASLLMLLLQYQHGRRPVVRPSVKWRHRPQRLSCCCWPLHSTAGRDDLDIPGFMRTPPFLVHRFTLLGAVNLQHCPDQNQGGPGLIPASAQLFPALCRPSGLGACPIHAAALVLALHTYPVEVRATDFKITRSHGPFAL